MIISSGFFFGPGGAVADNLTGSDGPVYGYKENGK
jgi:hypothetical protein